MNNSSLEWVYDLMRKGSFCSAVINTTNFENVLGDGENVALDEGASPREKVLMPYALSFSNIHDHFALECVVVSFLFVYSNWSTVLNIACQVTNSEKLVSLNRADPDLDSEQSFWVGKKQYGLFLAVTINQSFGDVHSNGL